MARIFGRVARVTVAGRPTGFVASNPTFFERLGNAIEIDQPRIRFQVTKNLGKEPNKCTIKVHNLAETTRTELERGTLSVTLHAGYDNVYRLITTGDMRRCYSQREGTDIVTVMQVSDGARAFAHARVNRSYKPPIQVSRVLADCAKSMNLTLPPEIEQSAELRQALQDGISTRGPTREILTRLLAPYGYTWSVQNGKLQILRDEDLRPGEAILVDENTPIINTPERTYPDKPGGKSEVKFDVFLYPEINPGSRVRLRSEFISLDMKVTDVTHVGDTDNGDMKTSVNGKPLE